MLNILLFLSLCFANALEQPFTLVIQGKTVPVKEASYFVTVNGQERRITVTDSSTSLPASDKTVLNDVVLKDMTEFTFARGSKMSLNGALYLHTNGNIRLASANESKLVEWKTPAGQTLLLNCGWIYTQYGTTTRYLEFHDNGQIAKGCSNVVNTSVQAANGSLVQLGVLSGLLDFNRDGLLEYVQKGFIENFVFYSQRIQLEKDKPILFNVNNSPEFFTMARDQQLSILSRNYGKMVFTNPPDKLESMYFHDNKKVQRGYLSNQIQVLPENSSVTAFVAGPGRTLFTDNGLLQLAQIQPQTLKIAGLTLNVHKQIEMYASNNVKTVWLNGEHAITLAGHTFPVANDISFYEDDASVSAINTSSTIVQVGGKPYRAFGLIVFDKQQRVRLLQVEVAMTVTGENGQNISVYAKEVLVFDEGGSVVGIKVIDDENK